MPNNFNIWPDSVIRTNNSDGSVTTSELYSFEAYKNNGFLIVIFFSFLIAVFGPAFGPLLLLLYSFDVNEAKSGLWTAFLASLLSTYFLIDIRHGWLISSLALMHYDTLDRLRPFVYLNGGSALGGIICFLFGQKIYRPLRLYIDSYLSNQGNNFKYFAIIRVVFILIISIIFLASWLIAYLLISSNTIKII